MLFLIRFVDKANSQKLREQYLQDHISWLNGKRKEVVVAGSLREDLDAKPVGACWIVKANDKIEVEELFKSDPFWIHGMRESFEILYWSKAFPDEQTLV